MRIRLSADGRVLSGSSKQIAEAMRGLAFGQESRSLASYITWAAEQAKRMNEVELLIQGESDEERAASLVEAMLRTGLARRV